MSENTSAPKENPLFYQIVLTFHTAAWQQLGKVVNPFTEKSEVNLQAASLSIDMLDALQEKTKGNLAEQEKQLLEKILSDLKLNYMEELKKQERAAAEKTAAEAESKEGESEPEAEEEADNPDEGEKTE